VITLPRDAQLDAARARLQNKLEQEYEGHTARLSDLVTDHATRPPHPIRQPDQLDVARALRSEIADVALALRRMAEGCYGRCELCSRDISLELLELRPAARFCPACHSRPLG
jgi:DnaK suppressor protein